METVAMRIPKSMQKDVRELARIEKLDQSTALRKLLEMGVAEWRLELALKQLQEGKITTWKAAELARITLWDMIEVVQKRGVVLPMKADDIIADIEAALKSPKSRA